MTHTPDFTDAEEKNWTDETGKHWRRRRPRYTEAEIKTAVYQIVQALERDDFFLEFIEQLRKNKYG